MDAAKAFGIAAIVALSVGLVLVARRIRSRSWTSRGLLIATCASLAVLVALVISDWPTDQLNTFWAAHSVLAAVVTTVLLAAVAFLAFEAREASAQERLGEKVSTAGLAGLVDHLVDVDLVLFMLSQGRTVGSYSPEGRPLRWLADTRRNLLEQARIEGGRRRDDPTLFSAPLTLAIRADVLEQAVRRVAAGMRDWASLLSVSSDGREALVALGEVRLRLLRIAGTPADAAGLGAVIDSLRRHVQLLAHAFETASSGEMGRAGVLTRGESEDVRTVVPEQDLVDAVSALRGERFTVILAAVARSADAGKRDPHSASH
ncbi:hypothetical protein ACMYYO_01010 [Dermacoccaceae bacterium W4C1]